MSSELLSSVLIQGVEVCEGLRESSSDSETEGEGDLKGAGGGDKPDASKAAVPAEAPPASVLLDDFASIFFFAFCLTRS